MESGAISLTDIPGPLDLQSTLESGQTYRWSRADGRMYERTGLHGGSAWYHSTTDGELIRVRQMADRLEWEATIDPVPVLRRQLRLDDDLTAIEDTMPSDPVVDAAVSTYRGMRIVRDPLVPCLLSFICSAQMRVERIFEMQVALMETYGEAVTVEDETYHGYPTPERLAATSETELRDLGLGYRAPYVRDTAALLAEEAVDIPRSEDYESVRDALTAFVGVGNKVADCVCLFSLGHLEAVPLDTWIRGAIEEHYPDCARGSYEETSRAIRTYFGPYAGYTQTYVFHYLRHRGR